MLEESEPRRPRGPLARRLIAVGTGCIVLAIPLVAATTASAATPAAHATVRAAPATYTVVPGDSLAKIAADHSLSGGWKKLYEDNRAIIGNDPSLIHPGLKLTLGAKAQAQKPAKATTGATATATGTTAPAKGAVVQAAAKTYANNLDGWIAHSLDVMAVHGIPGTHDGIYRNVMRESSGNPMAINLWDSNAAAGTPSKGLLQVIAPTFQAYHVSGTSFDIYDPVANITAACNYAADRYGSIDNVNGPY